MQKETKIVIDIMTLSKDDIVKQKDANNIFFLYLLVKRYFFFKLKKSHQAQDQEYTPQKVARNPLSPGKIN